MFPTIPKSIKSEYLIGLSDEYVPAMGKADTELGEILRAYNRIVYRYFNDGDYIGEDYGRETCNPAARYLIDKLKDDKIDSLLGERVDDIYGISESEYEDLLEELTKFIESYVKENFDELSTTSNTIDMLDYKDESDYKEYGCEDEDDWDEDEDEWEDHDTDYWV